MKTLIVAPDGQNVIYNRSFIPRIGDRVDAFYEPLPTVTGVIAWPSNARLAAMGIRDHDIEAIITVE